jgi:hypothetical protein
MEKLLHEDPERRLTIEQIKAHAWFNGKRKRKKNLSAIRGQALFKL